MASEVDEFASSLNDEVRDRAGVDSTPSRLAESFATKILELFEDAGIAEETEMCVADGRLGRSPWELSGWAFPPSDEEDLTQIFLLSILFFDNPVPPAVSADDLRRRFELATNFVRAVLDGRADELEPAAEIAALGRIIHSRRGALRRILVHIATDGLTQRLKEIESLWIGDIEIACSIWDVERLGRLSDPKQEEIEIDIPTILDGRGLPCLRVPGENPLYDAYLCVVPGLLLHYAYEMYGQRLLELNVRSFLAATGKVNRGIRDTIRSQPDRFFAFNNGLAMVARTVELCTNSAGQDEIVRIVGLQIVNGGQTTASIHRAWKLDAALDQVKKTFVQGKLTVIKTEEGDDATFVDLVRSISKHANSQNAVKDDDLEANQPWHVLLEKLSRLVWSPDAKSQWFYERARGSYATTKLRAASSRVKKVEFELQWPRSQVITKTDLAKCWNAWGQRPEIVSLGGQKNFRQFMSTLDDQILRPALDEDEFKRIVGKIILMRDTTRIINQLKEDIPAYRANVVAYLVSYLSFRMPNDLDFDRIWEKQTTPEAVKEVLREWAKPIYDRILLAAGGRNVTEWCKKADCWTVVRTLNLSTAIDLARYSGNGGAEGNIALADSDDAADISECLRLTPDEWENLLAWAMRDQNTHWKVRGIVTTLRSYALSNWMRRPSPKQARAARKAIDRWRSKL